MISGLSTALNSSTLGRLRAGVWLEGSA